MAKDIWAQLAEYKKRYPDEKEPVKKPPAKKKKRRKMAGPLPKAKLKLKSRGSYLQQAIDTGLGR